MWISADAFDWLTPQIRIWPSLKRNFLRHEHVMPFFTVYSGNTRILSLTRFASVGGRAYLNFCPKFTSFRTSASISFEYSTNYSLFEQNVYIIHQRRCYWCTRSRWNYLQPHSPWTLRITYSYRQVTPLHYFTWTHQKTPFECIILPRNTESTTYRGIPPVLQAKYTCQATSNLHCIWSLNPYRAVNTLSLSLGYKSQLVNVV